MDILNYIWHKIRPHKTYSIRKLTESREEYIVEEVYTILNFDLWGAYFSSDGHSGGVPFESYFAAKEYKKQLEKIEKKAEIQRDINFVFRSLGIIGVGILIYILC